MTARTCIVEGCDREVGRHGARGCCSMHYKRWRSTGDTWRPSSIYERFMSFVDTTGGSDACHLWLAVRDRGGYGQFTIDNRTRNAHRVAYELIVGPIPDGLQLDHLCSVRHCVNPAHLEPVTNRENTLRGLTLPALNARKTHCKRGHEFTPENTYMPPKRPQVRDCRVCRRAVARRAS